MLTAFDDFQFHQTPGPFSHVISSDLRWFDKTFYAVFNPNEKIMLTTGTVVHTNVDLMDAYVCLAVGGKQHNIRCSRRLRPRFGETVVGPIRQEVIKGMREIRLVLDENEYGISFDIRWESRVPAHQENRHFSRQNGRVLSDYTRYDQVGRCSGVLSVGGETFELTPEHWWGARDHSWGVRPGMAPEPDGVTPPPPVPADARRSLVSWNCLQLEDHSVFFMGMDNPAGQSIFCDGAVVFPWDQDKPSVRLVGWEHDLKFVPGSVRLQGSEITLIDERGNRRSYQSKATGLVLSCQGQGDFDGFADGRGWGVYRGDYHQEYEIWDLAVDPTRVTNLTDNGFTPQAYYLENIMEITDGKSRGYALQEVGVFGPYPRYGFADRPGA